MVNSLNQGWLGVQDILLLVMIKATEYRESVKMFWVMMPLSILKKHPFLFGRVINCVKGAGSRNVTSFFRNDDFAVFFIGRITLIFHCFSQNESIFLEMDSCSS